MVAAARLSRGLTVSLNGLVYVDNVIPTELRRAITSGLDAIAALPEKDFHPGSEGMVQNLIHPSLYAYQKDVTPLQPPSVPVLAAPDTERSAESAVEAEVQWHSRPDPFANCTLDHFCESTSHQWLPAEVDVDDEGNAHFLTYINNLDRDGHGDLYQHLEQLLSLSLPMMEGAMSEIRSRHGRHRFSYGRRAVDAAAPISLRGRRLQVIVKAANYILRSGEEYNGSWHVEGLPSEGIVCTAIHYYDTTQMS